MSYVERISRRALPMEAPDSGACRTLDELVTRALSTPTGNAEQLAELRERIAEATKRSVSAAFEHDDGEALHEIHRALFAIYDVNFINPTHVAAEHQYEPWLIEARGAIETAWMRRDEALIEGELPSEAEARDPDALAAWFKASAEQRTALDQAIEDHLEHRAALDQIKNFIVTDGYLNYRFYDALILAAQSYSEPVKAEISHHIWEECGEGDPSAAHTSQFSRSLESLGLGLPRTPVWTDWRPYAGFNLYFMLGLRRRYFFRALGSLAMPELFDPTRDAALNRGLARLGYAPEEHFEYYHSHEVADVEHGESWVTNIIRPIVIDQPEAGRELAIGGALRMLGFRRYNEYLADTLGVR